MVAAAMSSNIRGAPVLLAMHSKHDSISPVLNLTTDEFQSLGEGLPAAQRASFSGAACAPVMLTCHKVESLHPGRVRILFQARPSQICPVVGGCMHHACWHFTVSKSTGPFELSAPHLTEHSQVALSLFALMFGSQICFPGPLFCLASSMSLLHCQVCWPLQVLCRAAPIEYEWQLGALPWWQRWPARYGAGVRRLPALKPAEAAARGLQRLLRFNNLATAAAPPEELPSTRPIDEPPRAAGVQQPLSALLGLHAGSSSRGSLPHATLMGLLWLLRSVALTIISQK